MDGELRRQLGAVVGEGALTAGEGIGIPATIAEVAAMVAVCVQSGTPLAVTSGASGAEPGSGLLVSLVRLCGISVDAANGVVRAEAGATVAKLRTAVDAADQALVGLAGTTDAHHVGALIARGEVPARALTGIELVLTTGDTVTSGGLVLKDVAGYDLPAVMLGSMGRLAIIVAATFRLKPGRAGLPAPSPMPRRARTAGSRMAAAFDPRGLLRPRD